MVCVRERQVREIETVETGERERDLETCVCLDGVCVRERHLSEIDLRERERPRKWCGRRYS